MLTKHKGLSAFLPGGDAFIEESVVNFLNAAYRRCLICRKSGPNEEYYIYTGIINNTVLYHRDDAKLDKYIFFRAYIQFNAQLPLSLIVSDPIPYYFVLKRFLY